MARLFDNADNQELVNDSGAQVTDVPVTMACWFRADELIQMCLMSLANVDVTGFEFRLSVRGDQAGNEVAAAHRGDTSGVAESTSGFTVNQWHHGCAVFASSSSRSAFIDGGSKGTETTSANMSGVNGVTIGRTADSTPAIPMSGRIAEAAMWNVALADAEVAALASGILPLHIRPEKLVHYWPLHGIESPELEYRFSRVSLTLVGDVGSPTLANHAPVVPFSSRFWGDIPLIAVAGTAPVGVLQRGVIAFAR